MLPPNEYVSVYAWTTLGSGPAIDLQKMPILAKKNHIFRWSSFWSWRVCKQAKFGAQKTRTHILKSRSTQNESLFSADFGPFFSKMSREKSLQSMAIVTGPCWTNFCSMFCALFLKIALSAAELMSFGHLGAAIWHRWTIICGVSSNIGVTPTSQRQLTL